MNDDGTHHEEDDKHEGDENDLAKKNLHRQHDSGAADLERVTDYQEERELLPQASASAVNLLNHRKILDEKAAKENEMAKIVIRKEDLELIMYEMEVTKAVAERKLREHRGNVKETLRAMIAVPGI